MDKNLRIILQQLEAEKSVNRETLLEAIRSAIESAARKSMTHAAEVIVEVDPNNVEFKVFEIRTVVEEIVDEHSDMLLEDAVKLNPDAQIGNRLKFETQPEDFGRIAAQTAKQVIIQKIKDAERDNIYDEFKGREGEIVSGIVKRYSHGNLIVTVDKAEAIIPAKEQAGRESFRPGDRIHLYGANPATSPAQGDFTIKDVAVAGSEALLTFEERLPLAASNTQVRWRAPWLPASIRVRVIMRKRGSGDSTVTTESVFRVR